MRKISRIFCSVLVLTIYLCGLITPLTTTVAHAESTNLIANPSVETPSSTNAALPQSWLKGGWGTNKANYSYPTSGYNGTRSVQVQLSSYTSGDAKWYFAPVAVQPGASYTFSDYYKSTVGTQVVAQFYNGTSYSYQSLGNVSSSSTWKQFSTSFVVPTGITQVTVFHLIKSVGTLTTDNFSLTKVQPSGFSRPLLSITFDDGYAGVYTYAAPLMQKYGFVSTQYIIINGVGARYYMTLDQIKALRTQGHEIGSHTVTHPRLAQVTSTQLQTELSQSKSQLESWFGVPVTNLAYPYGSYNTAVKTAAANYYASARSVEIGYNSKSSLDRYNIRIQKVINTTTTAEITNWVAQAKATNTWLVLTYHSVDPNTTNPASGVQYNVTPTQLDSQLAAIKTSGITVRTMQQALAEITPQL